MDFSSLARGLIAVLGVCAIEIDPESAMSFCFRIDPSTGNETVDSGRRLATSDGILGRYLEICAEGAYVGG